MRMHRVLLAALALLALAPATSTADTRLRMRDSPIARETSVRSLRLAGPISTIESELSGLAWLDDDLVLLPQFPQRFGDAVFVIPGRQVRDAVHGRRLEPLQPRMITMNASDIAARVPGFEGFEAITFDGADVYLTIESKREGVTVGWLVHGTVAPSHTTISLDVNSLRKLAPETSLDNMGYESVLVLGDEIVALYEVNAATNVAPRGRAFGRDLVPHPPLPVARIEYRITDATPADAYGRFWATNVYWPGESWQPADCELFRRFGKGPTHASGRGVERLIELELVEGTVRPTGRAPLQLSLRQEGTRNWEGIARLGSEGLLLVTDEHPSTQLAFVPF